MELFACSLCGEPVTLTDIQREQAVSGQVFLIYRHESGCGKIAQQNYENHEWAQVKRGIPKPKPYDPEVVGRQVQGFRIDLDGVETIVDIEAHWFDDRRYRVGLS